MAPHLCSIFFTNNFFAMKFLTHLFSAADSKALTARETEIMALLAQGLLYKEIADRLYISEGTVKQHVNHLYRKLKARNRTEAILKFQALETKM